MPAIQTILNPMHCADANQLETLLSVAQVRGYLTRNQAICARIAAIHALPATIELRQRTAKSVTHVLINGAHTHTINARAKLAQVFK